jgi:anti-sigma regulatory factor (Ser/Thr protein kinase)
MTPNDITPPNQIAHDHAWQTLTEFTLSRESSSASLTTDRIVEAVQTLNWSDTPLERLKDALTEAIRNTMECSCRYSSEAPLLIRVLIPKDSETTRAVSQAGDESSQRQVSEQTVQQVRRSISRGWGFFLIQKQEDTPQVSAGKSQDVTELFLYQERAIPYSTDNPSHR